MKAIDPDGVDQFRIRFADLAKTKRGEPVQIDPFLIAQAIALVMRECTMRSATGKPLVWNDYRLIMARGDYERIRPLSALLEQDLKTALATEAATRKAELVGALRVTVVADEADELAHAHAVVRTAFVATAQLSQPRVGELTMRFDAWDAPKVPSPGSQTVFVDDRAPCTLRWPGGHAALPANTTLILGRPHADAPPQFVALTGAPPTVSKQHVFITATDNGLKVGRFPKANPVHVNGELVEPGAELEVARPAEISLSRGDLTITAM
jgi:hypothetical protein